MATAREATTIWADDFAIVDLASGIRYQPDSATGRVAPRTERPTAVYVINGRSMPSELRIGRSGGGRLGQQLYVLETL